MPADRRSLISAVQRSAAKSAKLPKCCPCRSPAAQPPPPRHEGLKLRRDGFTSGLVDQSPVGVEGLLSERDHDFRLGERQGFHENERLAKVVLHADRTESAGGCPHDGDRFALERLVRRARRPIDRVLEHARYRVVVLLSLIHISEPTRLG